MEDINTGDLLSILGQEESSLKFQTFKECYLKILELPTLPEYLSEMLVLHNIEKTACIETSTLSRTYAYQIFSGKRKPGRNRLLALCLSMHLSLKETQLALNIAQLAILFPKRKRDAVIIFALEKKLSVQQTNHLLFELEEKYLITF